MTRRITLTIGLALAALLVAPAAFACGPGHGRGHGPGGPDGEPMLARMAKHLDLTEDQQARIKALHEAAKPEREALEAALDTLREEMHALWQAETPDEGAILAKQAEMDPLRQQLRAQHVRLRLAVHALLTPEQREKARASRGQRGERFGKRGKRGERGMRGRHGPEGCPGSDLDE